MGNIQVHGARQHNLKDVSVSIPRDSLTVITGPSGSGKSTLAFDTLYAEGQRRYVESLSIHARQFLEQVQKPDVDQIEGLPPTIAIEQRAASSNPRSTVATTTEVYDFLRALYARVGIPHCWECGRRIASQSVAQIADAVMTAAAGEAIMILAPLKLDEQGGLDAMLERLRKDGLVRIRLDGQILRLDDDPPAAQHHECRLEAVVDRLRMKDASRTRLADSLEYALSLGDGVVIVNCRSPNGSEDRVFTARLTCSHHPDVIIPEMTPRLFSFNSPFGACPDCGGLGTVLEFDPTLVIADEDLSLAQGAIEPWRIGGKKFHHLYQEMLNDFCDRFGVAAEAPIRNIKDEARRILLHGTTAKEARAFGGAFEGVIPNLKRRWDNTENESMKQKLHAFLSEAPCHSCGGSRMRPEARAVQVGGRRIDEVAGLTIRAALGWTRGLEFEGEPAVIAAPLLRAIETRLAFLDQVGVGYLTLNRGSATLSGGEAQRIRLGTQVGSGLVGVCYVLDEPTIGLHPRDNAQLVSTLQHLRDLGNTVIVVEHDPATIQAADHVIDMGPGAGERGGRVIAQGSLKELMADPDSITGQYLSGRKSVPIPEVRRPVEAQRGLEIRGAREHNLQNIDIRIPLGCFVCVTGVSGSGKSTLINEILVRALKRRLYNSRQKPGDFDRLVGAQHVDKIIEIDQSPIGRTPRSNPATYVGVFDLIRNLYAKTREAKIRGYSPSRFSFNTKGGRCEACQGQGTKRIEMHFLPDIFVACDVCKEARYNRETLEIRYRGSNIAEVLNMRVEEARLFFDSFAKIKQLLQALSDVGLGYLTLGQASTTLSGGEAQRVKLAAELGKSPSQHTLYILDEPTTGLHFSDICSLLNVLNRLVDQGNTVLVIEHNLEIVKVADWVIDLGPEGGDGGGQIVAVGSPEQIATTPQSHTGRFLKDRLRRSPPLTRAKCAAS